MITQTAARYVILHPLPPSHAGRTTRALFNRAFCIIIDTAKYWSHSVASAFFAEPPAKTAYAPPCAQYQAVSIIIQNVDYLAPNSVGCSLQPGPTCVPRSLWCTLRIPGRQSVDCPLADESGKCASLRGGCALLSQVIRGCRHARQRLTKETVSPFTRRW